ncbi:MAG: DUF4866 family protein [Evtepia sp.]
MTSLFPRETHPEALFQKILSQPQAKARLYETFCAELEDYTDTEGLVSRTMPYGLLRAYETKTSPPFWWAVRQHHVRPAAGGLFSSPIDLAARRGTTPPAHQLRTGPCRPRSERPYLPAPHGAL